VRGAAMTPPTTPAMPPGTRRRLELPLAAAAFLFVACFYGWTVRSAGGLGPPQGDDYYHQLVEGFRHGHLYLPYVPNPKMLALADPYDPAQNREWRVPDASYYRGHYYLYFGPTPVLTLMWPYEWLTGRAMSSGTAVLVFVLAGYAALAGLWLALRRRYFPESSPWAAALGLLILGLATHVLALARRPDFWELPIASAFACTTLAWAAVYAGLHGRRPAVAFGVAGLLLGLAVGARPPALFGAVMLAAPLGYLWRQRPARRRAWVCAGAAAVPFGLCVAAILAYNYARFGRPLEFGQNYQLTGIYESHARHFSLRYALPNLAIYGLSWPRWSWQFPFLSAPWSGSAVPGYLGGEEICGVGVTFPFLWLALASPLAWRGRPPETAGALRAMIGGVAAGGLAVGGLLVCYFSATERYLAEFTPALALLAVIGLLALERWRSRVVWRRLVLGLAGLAGAVSVVLGVLLSFDYHSRLMRTTDAPAWARLSRLSRQALDHLALWTGASQGPAVFRVRFPDQPAGTIATLLRAGAPPATESVLVEHLPGRRVRLGWQRAGAAPLWGRATDCAPGRAHDVTIQTGALYPAADLETATGLQADTAFRERTGVALWIDGQLVLSAIAADAPGSPAAAAAHPAEFQGTLRRTGTRVFAAQDLLSSAAANWVLAGPLPAASGPGIPLLSWGPAGAGDTLILRVDQPGVARLAYAHQGGTERTSPEFPVDPRRDLTIEVEHGPRWPWAGPATAGRPLVVWADNRLVWQERVPAAACAANEVVVGRNRAGAAGCAAAAPGWRAVPPPPAPPPGGTLRLRLILPPGPTGVSDPLLALGQRPGASDILSIQYLDHRQVRFRFDHWGSPLLQGPPVRLGPEAVHVVEVTVPSCNAGSFGTARTGEIRVRLDGAGALRAVSACAGFGPDAWQVGRNGTGAATCREAFTGWVLDARWLATPIPPAAAGGRPPNAPSEK
jgi:hypothetical protein